MYFSPVKIPDCVHFDFRAVGWMFLVGIMAFFRKTDLELHYNCS